MRPGFRTISQQHATAIRCEIRSGICFGLLGTGRGASAILSVHRGAKVFKHDGSSTNFGPLRPNSARRMKDDVRKIGCELAERWLQRKADFARDFREALRQPKLHPRHDFVSALYQFARGDAQYLIAYLRSHRQLTSANREQLAQVLEGALVLKKKRGRPRDLAVHGAAVAAGGFYRAWLRENRQRGIKDHGQREAMKDEAIRFVVEELEPHSPPVGQAKVRDLLDRPKSRRN